MDPNLSESPPTTLRPGGRERLRVALEAVSQAIASPGPSLDPVRRLVERYGALARDQAVQLDEMLQTLTRTVCGALDTLPSPQRAEVLASVQWWAVHGYHRAD